MGEIFAVKIPRAHVKNPVRLYMHVISVSGGRDRRLLRLCWPIDELQVIYKIRWGTIEEEANVDLCHTYTWTCVP